RPHGTKNHRRKPAPQAANAPRVALSASRRTLSQTRARAIRQVRVVLRDTRADLIAGRCAAPCGQICFQPTSAPGRSFVRPVAIGTRESSMKVARPGDQLAE